MCLIGHGRSGLLADGNSPRHRAVQGCRGSRHDGEPCDLTLLRDPGNELEALSRLAEPSELN